MSTYHRRHAGEVGARIEGNLPLELLWSVIPTVIAMARTTSLCAEYCGTNHSGMIGSVTVMEPPAYQTWLAGGGEGSLAQRGAALFQQLACNTCHLDTGQGRGPSLKDIYGKPVELADGSTVTVNEL